MRSILVPVSGTNSDSAVLAAAFTVAAPLKSHLDFVHVPICEIEPSDYNHHIEFARGSGVETALKETLLSTQDAAAKARAHVADYCTSKSMHWASYPGAFDRVTASWISGLAPFGIEGLVKAGRAHDLSVVARSAGGRSWSRNLLEALATETGRPVLIVPSDCREMALGTIAVWWKDHAAAGRVVTAALPLLRAAESVVLLNVPEDDNSRSDMLSDLSDQLGWNGVDATVEIHDRGHHTTVRALWSASLARQADVVVMGGYSRSRIKEMVFGGCTQSVLDGGARPVFMLH